MKLKNLILSAVPLLFSCGDFTSPKPKLLSLRDYACGDEECSTLGMELPKNGVRPLRFISMARYPGRQDYHWEMTWTDTLTDETGKRVPIPQKNWYEISKQDEYSALKFNLVKASCVEYRILVSVRDESIISYWRPE